jgi:hypothetical protein
MKRRDLRANLFGELLFIAENRRSFDKFLQVTRKIAWNFRWCVLRLRGGRTGAQRREKENERSEEA